MAYQDKRGQSKHTKTLYPYKKKGALLDLAVSSWLTLLAMLKSKTAMSK